MVCEADHVCSELSHILNCLHRINIFLFMCKCKNEMFTLITNSGRLTCLVVLNHVFSLIRDGQLAAYCS